MVSKKKFATCGNIDLLKIRKKIFGNIFLRILGIYANQRQNSNSIAIEFCLSDSLLLSFLAAGNATLACGYENFVLSGHFNS
jgi:hypothetical protein